MCFVVLFVEQEGRVAVADFGLRTCACVLMMRADGKAFRLHTLPRAIEVSYSISLHHSFNVRHHQFSVLTEITSTDAEFCFFT